MENEKLNPLFFRFEDLRIYNKALDYICWVQNHTYQFPDNVKSALTTRFSVAAQAIAINIAEGSGRNKTQFIYYLKMAKSSIRECIVYTSVCNKLQLLDDNDTEESRTFLIEMTKMIGALIASLQKSERQHERNDDEYEDNHSHDQEI